MNAIILAAGLGTRLRPLTDDCPKALVQVAGRPMLEWQILKLKDAGFENIVVNVHYLGRQIVDFLSRMNNFGLNIMVSDERDLLLDTGGGIARAGRMFDNDAPVLVHNVDVFTDIDLGRVYRDAWQYDAMLVVQRRCSSRMLYFDDDMRLRGWMNKKTGETKSSFEGFVPENYGEYAFSGVHVFGKRALQAMGSGDRAFPLIPFYLSAAVELDIRGVLFPEQASWVDAGTPKSLVEAERIVMK